MIQRSEKMKARVDENLCTGCGPCEDICPQVFHIENNLAKVKVGKVPESAEIDCRDAMETCPVAAISIE
jgi:ferredoxin